MFSTFTSSNVPKPEDNSLLTVTLSAVISLPDKLPIVAVADSILPADTIPFDFILPASISVAVILFAVRFSTVQFAMFAVVAVISSKVAFEAFISPVTVMFPPTFKSEAIVAKSAVKVANDDIPETVNDVIFAVVNLAVVASNIEIAACKAFIWPVVIFLPIAAIYWDRFSDTLSNEADMALIWFDKSWMSCLVAILFSWLNKLFVCSLSENIFLIF